MSVEEQTCATEKVAAFIDGELDVNERIAFEAHVVACARCKSELLEQKQFMCELDSALAGPFDLEVPHNFARIVSVRAESDMRGVRAASEHKRAFYYAVLLGLAAFALLGVTASQALFASVELIAVKVISIGELLLRAAYDAALSVTVVVRVLSGGLFSDTSLSKVSALVVVVFAIGLLSFLISRYHRAGLAE
jgi:anti-sigma factor RsiW